MKMWTFKRELCLPILLLTVGVLPAFAQTDSVEPALFRLTVRENRSKKDSRPLSLAVARFIGSASKGTIPFIYVSGGSGAGISAVTGTRRPFFQALRQLGDVVAFDIRGTGLSTPRLSCDSSLRIERDRPLTRAALIAATRDANRACAATLRAQGFDLSGYNGREIVEDIEDLRRHLGVERIRLFGTSTGTHLALEYVRAHPNRVAAVILAGTEGPGQTAHLPSGMDAAVTALTADKPQLLASMSHVFTTLDATPVTVDVKGTPVGLGGYDARLFVASTLGDRGQMAMLQPLFASMEAGNYANVAGLKLQALKQTFQSPWESLHDCQAGTADVRAKQVEAQAKTALLGYATLDFVEACDEWGTAVLPAQYRTPITSTVPALFISGTLDGRTPVANADDVRRGFRNSAHLIVDGASHGDDLFLSSPAILESVLAFARQPHTRVTHATAK